MSIGQMGDIAVGLGLSYDSAKSQRSTAQMIADVRRQASQMTAIMAEVERHRQFKESIGGRMAGGFLPSTDQFRAFRTEADKTTRTLHSMTAAMGQNAMASSRLMAGLEASGAQARTASILQMARTPLSRRTFGSGAMLQSGDLAYMRQSAAAMDIYGRSSSRATMRIMEMGRGIEDAAIGFQMQGIGGAFRGAANNIGTLLTAWGPWPMLIFSSAVAIGVLGQKMGWFGGEVESTEDKIKRLNERMERTIELRQRSTQLQHLREDVSSVASADSDIAERQQQLQLLVIDRQVKEAAAMRAQFATVGAGWRHRQELPELTQIATNAQNAFNAALEKETQLREELAVLQDERNRLAENEYVFGLQQRQTDEAAARQNAQLEREVAARRAAFDMSRQIANEMQSPREAARQRRRDQLAVLNAGGGDWQDFQNIQALSRREEAGFEMAAMQRQHGNILGRRFGDASLPSTLETGSQESFRFMAQHRQQSQDPMRELSSISRQELATLNRIYEELRRQAEGELN